MRRPQLMDWLTLAALMVVWGSSFFMTKIAVTHINPVWVMALRLAVAGVFLLGFALATGCVLPREMKLWGWFAWLGLIGNAVPFFLISWGTQFVTSGLSGVLMGAIPLMVIVLAHFLLTDEKLNVMKSAGFAVGFAGLLIVLGIDSLSGFSTESTALIGGAGNSSCLPVLRSTRNIRAVDTLCAPGGTVGRGVPVRRCHRPCVRNDCCARRACFG